MNLRGFRSEDCPLANDMKKQKTKIKNKIRSFRKQLRRDIISGLNTSAKLGKKIVVNPKFDDYVLSILGRTPTPLTKSTMVEDLLIAKEPIVFFTSGYHLSYLFVVEEDEVAKQLQAPVANERLQLIRELISSFSLFYSTPKDVLINKLEEYHCLPISKIFKKNVTLARCEY